MASIEQRLQALEDIEAIRRLKVRYAELCDAGFDPDGLVSLFTEDGVWDAGEFGRFAGAEQMRQYWRETAAVTSFALHYMANHVIELEGDGSEATGRCYLLGTATRDGQAYWMAVRYAERYRKVDGRWLFAEMRLLPAFMTQYEHSWASAHA
jgi:ketosteroid isomerase-like protein